MTAFNNLEMPCFFTLLFELSVVSKSIGKGIARLATPQSFGADNAFLYYLCFKFLIVFNISMYGLHENCFNMLSC